MTFDINKIVDSYKVHLVFFFLFFSNYFFLKTAIFAYVLAFFFIAINFRQIKLNSNEVFSVLIFFFFFSAVFIISSDKILTLKIFKYYFGFIIFLFFLKTKHKKIYFNINHIRYVFIFIIIESILINFFIDSKYIYKVYHDAFFFNFYHRPSSFGGNASMTSTLLICFFYFLKKHYLFNYKFIDYLLLILCVALLFSMTGFVILFLMFCFNFFDINKIKIISIINIFSLIIIFFLFFFFLNYFFPYDSSSIANYQKISFSYLYEVIEIKFSTLIYYIKNFDIYSISSLIGYANQFSLLITNGESGLLDLYYSMGIVGFAIFFLIILIFKRNKDHSNLFLIIISSLHYPLIMSPVGQLFTAYFILSERKFYNN